MNRKLINYQSALLVSGLTMFAGCVLSDSGDDLFDSHHDMAADDNGLFAFDDSGIDGTDYAKSLHPTLHRAHGPSAASLLTGSRGRPDIIMDNHDATVPFGVSFSGSWPPANGASEHLGAVGRFAETGGTVDTYRFTPMFTRAANYRVMVWNNCFSPRAQDVPHTIVYDGGSVTIALDQDCATGVHGEWQELGTFPFAAGSTGYVEVSDEGLAPFQYIGVDGVRFLREDVIVVDNGEPGTSSVGNWQPALAASEHFGSVSVFAQGDGGNTASSYRFTPTVITPGDYEVSVWNSCFSPREHAVPHIVQYDGGQAEIAVDQDCVTGPHGDWHVLGTFPFAAGEDGYVEISNLGLGGYGYIGADAVRLVPVANCELIDDFENSWPHANWDYRGSGSVGTLDLSIVHSGGASLRDMGWYYNDAVSVGHPGDILSWWVYTLFGRSYLGFDSDGVDARSFVIAPNTGDIRFQDNPDFEHVELNRSYQGFGLSWYYVEAEFFGGGRVVGRVYAHDGTTLLNSLEQTYEDTDLSGGIAIRSFFGNRVDSVRLCR